MTLRDQNFRHLSGLVHTFGITPQDARKLMACVRERSESEGITDLDIIKFRQETAYQAFIGLEPVQIDHLLDQLN